RSRLVADALRPPRLGGLPRPFGAGVEFFPCLSPTRGSRRPRRRARSLLTAPPCPLPLPERPASKCRPRATEPCASTCHPRPRRAPPAGRAAPTAAGRVAASPPLVECPRALGARRPPLVE